MVRATEWPGVSRDGEPELIRCPQPGSVKRPNLYRIRTTPVPAGALHGVDWLGFFNSQLTRPPVSAYHDGSKITVECWPDHEPQLIEKVDSAIEYANERMMKPLHHR